MSSLFFDCYSEGKEDNNGRKIEKVIAHVQNDWIVYFVENNYVDVGFASESKLIIDGDIDKKISEIGILIDEKNSPKNEYVRERVSEALVQYLMDTNNKDYSLRLLNKLENDIIQKIKIERNISYFWSGGMVLFVDFILCLLVYNEKILIKNKEIVFIFYMMLVSGIGTSLHHLLLINEEKITDNILSRERINGIYKMFLAFVSGFFIYLVIKSNLILGLLSNNKYAILTLAFMVGYRNDILLNIINQLIKKMFDSEK